MSPPTCVHCKRPCDGKPAHPVRVQAVNGHDQETWCPTCFVFHRVDMEPGRWLRAYPFGCDACGAHTVAFGAMKCSACGSGRVQMLSPPENLAAAGLT